MLDCIPAPTGPFAHFSLVGESSEPVINKESTFLCNSRARVCGLTPDTHPLTPIPSRLFEGGSNQWYLGTPVGPGPRTGRSPCEPRPLAQILLASLGLLYQACACALPPKTATRATIP